MRSDRSEDERAEEHRDPHYDERVGEVEGRPGIEVEKVRHAAQAHAVDQIGDASTENEPQSDRQDGMPFGRAGEEPDHHPDRHGRDCDDEARPAREEPESDARVLDVVDGERAEEVDAFSDSERAPNNLLRELIGDYGRRCDCEQCEPLSRSGRQRAFGGRDGLQRVCGRPDPHIDLLNLASGLAHARLTLALACACRRCRAWPREPPPAAPRRSTCRRRRRCHTFRLRFVSELPRPRR